MSTDKIKLVQGDTAPQIRVIIRDDDTKKEVNINGASVVLKFRATGDTTLITTLYGSLLPGLEKTDGTLSLDGVYAQPGYGGRVAFIPTLEMTNNDAGSYEGELEVTFADGTIQTIYAPLKFQLREQF